MFNTSPLFPLKTLSFQEFSKYAELNEKHLAIFLDLNFIHILQDFNIFSFIRRNKVIRLDN